MIGVLQAILCVLQNLALSVLAVIIMAANAIVTALATLLTGLLALLPTMPDIPGIPTEITTAANWVSWFFPVGTVFSIMTFLVAFWVIWLGVSIAFRWAKAL